MTQGQRSPTWALCTEHEGGAWRLPAKPCPQCSRYTNAYWDMCGDCALEREVCQVCSAPLSENELALARSDRWAARPG